MMFPRRLAYLAVLLMAMTALLGGLVVGTPSATADDPAPVLHHVKYTVFSETPFRNAEIYYRDAEPTNYAEYSHNPYVFSPNVTADVGPNQMWTMDVMLANPDQWAMVTASILDSPHRPNIHCVLAVDGQVVVTNQGPKGALCSLRNW
jgi:hypothetical protein